MSDLDFELSVDPEIFDIFRSSAQEHLEKITNHLFQLENDRSQLTFSLIEIYRSAHTLKGDSNSVGLTDVGTIAHSMESFIGVLQKDIPSFDQNKLNQLFIYAKEMREQLALYERQLGLLSEPKELLGADMGNVAETDLAPTMLPNLSDSEAQNWLRVNAQKLDFLINRTDELGTYRAVYETYISKIKEWVYAFRRSQEEGRLNILKNRIETEGVSLLEQMRHHALVFDSLLEDISIELAHVRLLEFKSLFQSLRITVKNTALALGKNIQFSTLGEDIKVDRFILEKLKEPLDHILRNALDHGIESAEERRLNNKPESARIQLKVGLSGGDLLVELEDDGRGLDFNKIREKAIHLNLFSVEKIQLMSDQDLTNLLFVQGFSTADEVTNISGRGMGLDIVKNIIENTLQGSIYIRSQSKLGTRFSIRVSLQLTNFESILIQVAERIFAIPNTSLESIEAFNHKNITRGAEGQAYFSYREQNVPLEDLAHILEIERLKPISSESGYVMIFQRESKIVAVIIDDVLESRHIFMKPLGVQIPKLKNVSGATLLADGKPILVLNPIEIIDEVSGYSKLTIYADEEHRKQFSRKKVLVVDDSITTRTLEKNILETSGFDVVIGTNGEEGCQLLIQHRPDIVITDCEMPLMDGYGFTRWIRASKYKYLPVIMVTSLADDEFKRKGLDAGVDAYIVKGEFNQQNFLEKINKLLEQSLD